MKSKLLLALIAVFLALPLIPANGECNQDLGLRDTVRIGNVIVQDVVPGQLINVPIYVYSDEALVAMSFGFRWSGTNIRYANFTLAQEIVSLGFVRAPAYRSDTAQNLVGVGTYTFDPSYPIPANTTSQGIHVGTLTFMTKTGAVPSGIIIDSSFFGVDGPFVLYPASSSGLDQIAQSTFTRRLIFVSGLYQEMLKGTEQSVFQILSF